MTDKPQDDIRNMTNARLAEVLEQPMMTTQGNYQQYIQEAARRLRNLDEYMPTTHFNSEDFDL